MPMVQRLKALHDIDGVGRAGLEDDRRAQGALSIGVGAMVSMVMPVNVNGSTAYGHERRHHRRRRRRLRRSSATSGPCRRPRTSTARAPDRSPDPCSSNPLTWSQHEISNCSINGGPAVVVAPNFRLFLAVASSPPMSGDDAGRRTRGRTPTGAAAGRRPGSRMSPCAQLRPHRSSPPWGGGRRRNRRRSRPASSQSTPARKSSETGRAARPRVKRRVGDVGDGVAVPRTRRQAACSRVGVRCTCRAGRHADIPSSSVRCISTCVFAHIRLDPSVRRRRTTRWTRTRIRHVSAHVLAERGRGERFAQL